MTLVGADGATAKVSEAGGGEGSFDGISYGFGSASSTSAPSSASPFASVSSGASIVGLANASLDGYWLAATDGGVFSFNAPFYGSASGLNLSAPIVGMTPTPDRGGYWLVGADGGVFTYGDAGYYGSISGGSGGPQTVGLVPTQAGTGYWEIDADGGVFSYGAPFYGSLPGLGIHVDDVVSVSFYGNGYCMAEANGWVHCFTSAGNVVARQMTALDIHVDPATAIMGTTTRSGFYLVDRTGDVYTFGDAVNEGHLSANPYPILGGDAWGNAGYRFVGADGGVFDFNLSYQGNASVDASLSTTDAAQIGRAMLPEDNWGTLSEWNALNTLWGSYESGWEWYASDPTPCYGSNYAYGIPQACPGSKMSTQGPALPYWQTDAWTQIAWGFWYIAVGNDDYFPNGQKVTDPITAVQYENQCSPNLCGYGPTR